MLKKTFIAISIVLVFACSALAQNVYTPEKGSAERTAILSALRVPIEKELKQKIQFTIQTFNVQGNWAFINGEPQTLTGERPDFSKTVYREAIENGAFDNNFQAVLKKTGGKWKVLKSAIGCTDVCWLEWDKEFKAPKTIFPSYE